VIDNAQGTREIKEEFLNEQLILSSASHFCIFVFLEYSKGRTSTSGILPPKFAKYDQKNLKANEGEG